MKKLRKKTIGEKKKPIKLIYKRQPFKEKYDTLAEETRVNIMNSLANIYDFGNRLGVAGEDIAYLEKQYDRVRHLISAQKKLLEDAFEVIIPCFY